MRRAYIVLLAGLVGAVLHSIPVEAASCHSTGGYYTNSSGQLIPSPRCGKSQGTHASAICRDGSHSYSRHHRGTCSKHGGVRRFL